MSGEMEIRQCGRMSGYMVRLRQIRELVEATTAGPWDHAEMPRWPGRWDVWDRDGRKCIAEVLNERDAEFIARAPEDVKWLLDTIERLSAAADRGQG